MQVGSVQAGTGTGAAQAAKTSRLAYYDPADTNQDGTVSAAEELAYTLSHPLQSLLTAAAPAATKTAQGGAGLAGQTSLGFHAPADTNRDGVVSGLEALTYSLRHPLGGSPKAATPPPARTAATGHPAPYAQPTSQDFTAQHTNRLLDLNA